MAKQRKITVVHNGCRHVIHRTKTNRRYVMKRAKGGGTKRHYL